MTIPTIHFTSRYVILSSGDGKIYLWKINNIDLSLVNRNDTIKDKKNYTPINFPNLLHTNSVSFQQNSPNISTSRPATCTGSACFDYPDQQEWVLLVQNGIFLTNLANIKHHYCKTLPEGFLCSEFVLKCYCKFVKINVSLKHFHGIMAYDWLEMSRALKFNKFNIFSCKASSTSLKLTSFILRHS